MSRKREDAIAAGIQVKEIQHTMKRRTSFHNYCDKGTYMLTLVVEGRMPLFGTLKGDGHAPSGTANEPRVELSALGEAIRDVEIHKIALFYTMVEVWKLCIMPDHLHMIVRVKEEMPEGKNLGQVVRGFKTGCTRAWWSQMDSNVAAMPPSGEPKGTTAPVCSAPVSSAPVGAALIPAAPVPAAPVPAAFPAGSFPAGTTKCSLLFEKGYCDKILLRPGQLENWKRYLDDNPRRLAIKRQHPEFFTIMQHIVIGEWSCHAVGNRFLLSIPEKAAVIVHRAYSDTEFAQLKAQWLALGENGGVLVSAAIAPREKEVMREAMDRGYLLILLRENGFPRLYKPAGEAFTACSEGRLLQISPWDYHMQRKIISRDQCLQLNRLAEEIANNSHLR
jgi:REP element-mobilizing transposase RayT